MVVGGRYLRRSGWRPPGAAYLTPYNPHPFKRKEGKDKGKQENKDKGKQENKDKGKQDKGKNDMVVGGRCSRRSGWRPHGASHLTPYNPHPI